MLFLKKRWIVLRSIRSTNLCLSPAVTMLYVIRLFVFRKHLIFVLSLDGCVVGHSTTEEETALVHITSSKFTLSLDCCLFLSIVVVHLLRLVWCDASRMGAILRTRACQVSISYSIIVLIITTTHLSSSYRSASNDRRVHVWDAARIGATQSADDAGSIPSLQDYKFLLIFFLLLLL